MLISNKEYRVLRGSGFYKLETKENMEKAFCIFVSLSLLLLKDIFLCLEEVPWPNKPWYT